MRRRRAPGDGGGVDEEGLGEALLPRGEEPSDAPAQQQRGRQQQQQRQQGQLIVHSPFDLEAFLRFVWERWTALLRAIGGCIRSLLGQGAPRLSLVQSARLEELRGRVGVAYDGADPLHADALRQLWDLAFPGQPFPGPKGERWKDMGWQGSDPSTDFRAAGLLGLDCLVYLGRERPPAFRALLGKSNGARSDWEYPFGAAGMNVTWMLVELLSLHKGGGGGGSGGMDGGGDDDGGPVAATAAGRGFLGLLAAEECAFEEAYCAAYEVLDSIWLERRATYMEFNAVLAATRDRVARALAARPRDVSALRRGLGLPP